MGGPCLLQFEGIYTTEVALAKWQESERVIKGPSKKLPRTGMIFKCKTQKLLSWATIYHTLPTLSVSSNIDSNGGLMMCWETWRSNLDFSAPAARDEEGAASSEASGKKPGGPGTWSQKGKHESTLWGKT